MKKQIYVITYEFKMCVAMGLIFIVAALSFPLIFLIEMNPSDRQLLSSTAIAVVCIAALGLIYLPKMHSVMKKEHMRLDILKGTICIYDARFLC